MPKKVLGFFSLVSLNTFKELEDRVSFIEDNFDSILQYNLDSLSKSKLSKWGKEVRKIGKCDICSSKDNLTAHHKWPKAIHPSLAYQVENGVCLCDKCHKAFHKKFSYLFQVSPNMYINFKGICTGHLNRFGEIKYDEI